jgi:microcompartment protein CcmK/EutM
MIVCKVLGNVVSTNKAEKLTGLKLMVVRQMDIATGRVAGSILIVVDTVGAGRDEVVLVVNGSSARQTVLTDQKPVDAAIVAIIDSIEIENKVVFRKSTGSQPNLAQ